MEEIWKNLPGSTMKRRTRMIENLTAVQGIKNEKILIQCTNVVNNEFTRRSGQATMGEDGELHPGSSI